MKEEQMFTGFIQNSCYENFYIIHRKKLTCDVVHFLVMLQSTTLLKHFSLVGVCFPVNL